MQLAGWLPAHTLGVSFPGFVGLWFATFPTIEGLVAQLVAATLVIGSYFLAERTRLRAPRPRTEPERARETSSEPAWRSVKESVPVRRNGRWCAVASSIPAC